MAEAVCQAIVAAYAAGNVRGGGVGLTAGNPVGDADGVVYHYVALWRGARCA